MLVPDLLALNLSVWPLLCGHCFFTSLLLLVQFTQGDLQKSCSRSVEAMVSDTCHLACHCRPYPPLPPPPPPPPPPRLLVSSVVAGSTVPPVKPWWKEIAILGSVGCASGAVLLLTAVVCYKAIKRKPLRKEENGTSRGEYSMSSRCEKGVETTNALA